MCNEIPQRELIIKMKKILFIYLYAHIWLFLMPSLKFPSGAK